MNHTITDKRPMAQKVPEAADAPAGGVAHTVTGHTTTDPASVVSDSTTDLSQLQPYFVAGLPEQAPAQAPMAKASDVTKSTGLTAQAWSDELDHSQHKPWAATIAGRGAIRLFSRGIMGAAFYAIGGRLARNGLEHYRPGEAATNPVSAIAAGIDKFIGKPIESIATAMGHDGKALVTFRPTRLFYNRTSSGRTLGHEVIDVTADFAAMSIGDNFGRDIATALDPNVHHDWIDRPGHIDFEKVAKNVVSRAFHYVTYSAGEDWAMGVPYAFFIKGQRNLIDKYSPGFRYDSDRGLNGGSFKVDDHGKITGSFGFEGAMDLQSRFTVYNIGTLMYRETYMNIKNGLKHWSESGYQIPSPPASLGSAIHSAVDSVGQLSRWAMRDTIKATLYMIPSVPAFWMFRTPQSKYKGTFIHPEKGMIGYMGGKHMNLQAVHAHEWHRSTNKYAPESNRFNEHTPTFFVANDGLGGAPSHGDAVANPFASYGEMNESGTALKIDVYNQKHSEFDHFSNGFGHFNNEARRTFHNPIEGIRDHYKIDLNNEKLRLKNLTDSFVNASFAYTPYFFMKNDVMATNWDHAKMDMAIERAIDGATHFSPSEIKEGIGEVWASMQGWVAPHGAPFKDPARELAAQKAICDDESPADGQNFNANARCFDSALQDITLHSDYHKDTQSHQFVERLKDSKARSKNMMDQFKEDAAQTFAEKVQPAASQPIKSNSKEGFVALESRRKKASFNDFPSISTTLH